MKLNPKNRIFLAPMEEVNDIAFRLLCKKAGAGLNYSPMIHPKTQKEIHLQDKPVLQLFCGKKDADSISAFMKKYDSKVSAWDFNLGCPAKTAKKHCFGVFLNSDLKTIEKILKLMGENTKKPVMIKLRKSSYTIKIIKIANKYCDAVAIHPRTQSQGYSGEPDIKFAESLKKYTKLPIIYSGNVDETNYTKFLKKFDFVMIGRKAIGNPNIFSEITNKKNYKKITFADYLKLASQYNFPFRQLKFQAMQFTKGLKNGKSLRLKIFEVKDEKELRKFAKQEDF
ncbi:tRNA-dihydrouridine synthase family protein [archaeon]|jgi:tRNA-dihydrouridine synthase B|nr:tRNA-dihydrouridine synthase family protein [archaeon]MBT4373356.1 tRNA-dihydrouridine synthase family protein [archaeon]MBT4531804.1 tRNA-dihydrouridine synthase family protein [archaeon]MBT7001471.1 tRNA-dihydrouridine synthase family protein [archaeon]MBT7282637.1 tRNA-dihydrouridine synthase family protein [archaeon]